jgi:hypothetical protein
MVAHDGRVTSFNQAADQITCVRRKEAIGGRACSRRMSARKAASGFARNPSGILASVLVQVAGDSRILQVSGKPTFGDLFHIAGAPP